jgi:ubiquinone/menaquinone biosynthesis C-methylase UbiE
VNVKIDDHELKSIFSKLNMTQKLWATRWALDIWKEYDALKSCDTVVDLGCGERFAAVMSLDPTIRYVGFDVNSETVQAGARRYPQFRWIHADIKNQQYNPYGSVAPESCQLLIEENTADLVICASLFTHLETIDVAKNYLNEIRRISKPGAHLWISWFRSPPNEVCMNAGRTVFTEAEIINLIGGWMTVKFTTAGMTTRFHDQWIMLTQILK